MRRFLICLLLCALYVIVLSIVFPIRFEDNDDITYAWIASGVYSGSPDAHLVFLNALYGSVVAGLYSLLPAVEWYTVLFLFFLSLSAAVCVHRVWTADIPSWERWLAIGLIGLMLTYCVLRLQFTLVAAATAFAGVVLLCRRRWVIGGLLLVLGSLIRFEAAGMIGVMMVPALFYAYQWDWKKSWLPLAAVLLLVIGCHKAEGLFYRSVEWQRFMTCCNLTARGKINDNPNCWRVRKNLPEGVSETNYDLITAFAPDPETATPERLQAIDHALQDISLIKKAKNIPNIFLPRYGWWLLWLALAFLPIFMAAPNDKRWLAVIGFCLWLGMLLMVQLSASVKLRVFVSSLMPLLYLWLITIHTVKHWRWTTYGAGMLLAIVLSFGLLQPVAKHLQQVRAADEVWEEQRALLHCRNGRQVITDGPDLHVEYIDAFRLRQAIDPCSFINPYCFSGCPLSPAFMSYRDFVCGRLLLFTTVPVNVKMRLKALQENYGIEADYEVVAQTENYALVRFIAL